MNFAQEFGMDLGTFRIMQEADVHRNMMAPFLEAEKQRKMMTDPFRIAQSIYDVTKPIRSVFEVYDKQQRQILQAFNVPVVPAWQAYEDQQRNMVELFRSPLAEYAQSIQKRAELIREAMSPTRRKHRDVATPASSRPRRRVLNPTDHKKHLTVLAVLEPNTTVRAIQLNLL